MKCQNNQLLLNEMNWFNEIKIEWTEFWKGLYAYCLITVSNTGIYQVWYSTYILQINAVEGVGGCFVGH